MIITYVVADDYYSMKTKLRNFCSELVGKYSFIYFQDWMEGIWSMLGNLTWTYQK